MGENKNARGNSAQFFVAGELCRRNLVAVVTMGIRPTQTSFAAILRITAKKTTCYRSKRPVVAIQSEPAVLKGPNTYSTLIQHSYSSNLLVKPSA